MNHYTTKNPVKDAIHIIGSQTALAKCCGVAQQTVWKWLQKGLVPPRKVLMVEKLTGIPRQELNPIIYPD